MESHLSTYVQNENDTLIWDVEKPALAIPEGFIFSDKYYRNITAQLIISVISVFANALVIVVMIKNLKKDKTLHKYTKLSLAIVDLLTALVTMANASLLLYAKEDMNDTVISMWVYLTIFQMHFMTTSFCHLSLMSIRRYLAITSPIEYCLNSSKKRYFVFLFLIYIVGLAPVGVLIHARLQFGSDDKLMDMYFLRFSEWFILLASYVVPYIITVLSTLAMGVQYFIKKKKVENDIAKKNSIVVDRRRQERQKKMIVMISLIVAGYTFTCLPFIIQLSYFTIANMRYSPFEIGLLIPGTIMVANGLMDVLVYSLFDDKFCYQVRSLFYFSFYT